jgi:hypothetical protein
VHELLINKEFKIEEAPYTTAASMLLNDSLRGDVTLCVASVVGGAVSADRGIAKILTPLPENRELVHELLINKEFKIEEAPYTEPRRQIIQLLEHCGVYVVERLAKRRRDTLRSFRGWRSSLSLSLKTGSWCMNFSSTKSSKLKKHRTLNRADRL